MAALKTGTTSRRRAGTTPGTTLGTQVGTAARRETITEGKESTNSRRGSSTAASATRRPPRARSTRPGDAKSPPPRLPRQAPTTGDGIPVFDRNKVSLDFPGNLFGPSVSLLIKTTKIVGDVIQNSAVRYQTFLRLFRPLFRGQFEIKGLDPPSTTTPRPSPPPPAPPADADNEVRRRRGA